MKAGYTRRWTNLIVDPHFQFKFVLYFAASGSAVLLMLFVLLSNRVAQITQSLAESSSSTLNLESLLVGLLNDIVKFSFVGLLANFVIATALAIYMTHRISGPAKVLEGFLNDLSEDKYDSVRALRKEDDLQNVMAAAQKLANHLKTRRI